MRPTLAGLAVLTSVAVIAVTFSSSIPVVQGDDVGSDGKLFTFDEPIDGLSVELPTEDTTLYVSSRVGTKWDVPQLLEIDNEQDPELMESNLVLFSEPVRFIRISGKTENYEVHPVRVSHEPASYMVAARTAVGTPKILSRSQWGSDDSFLYTDREPPSSTSTEEKDANGGGSAPESSTGRVSDCEEAQLNYPQEFKASKSVQTDTNGKRLRWTRQYSPSIKLLAVHHTAIKNTGDTRSGVEKMRALYAYHSNNRGWGDIGYHYVIDESGQIYEGKSGGDYVVGGHAYCNNIGSLGVALMGSFDTEKPSQEQMKSLQWLLSDLGKKYNIDLSKNVTFHGKSMPSIVRHGDLVSTACPGYYVNNTITQVRKNVIAGNVDTSIVFPNLAKDYNSGTDARRQSRLSNLPPESRGADGLSALGDLKITGRPGGDARISVLFKTSTAKQKRARVGNVVRSNQRIGIWQEIDGKETQVRDALLLPEKVSAGGSATLRLRIQFPQQAGEYSLDIGNLTYVLNAEGRRARTPGEEPSEQTYEPGQNQTQQTPGYRRSSAQARSSSSRSTTKAATNSPKIRIRLGYEGATAALKNDSSLKIGAKTITANTEVKLGKEGDNCVALKGNETLASGIVRMDPGTGVSTISSWNVPTNKFRGVIECRIVDGALVLINELPLEHYLMGLSEEPDTEPYEKQRAFAIAARTYAAFYIDPNNRKFAGKPYDGDDSAARFQKYSGVVFEDKNAMWLKALESTSGLVITKNNVILKTPYFSADDGRTRSPEEVGWKNFPATEVFQSKPDPWCAGETLRGHGVGMSGCGAKAQALEGATGEDILKYYYPGTELKPVR